MLNYLITNSLKQSKALSDYILSVCLSYLMLIPDISTYFLSHDGVLIIKELLERNSKDL